MQRESIKQQQAAATRARLKAAAREAFARDGYAHAGTTAIAREAGVTRGALYHLFADKADLFRAVVEALQAEVLDAIERAAESAADPVAALVNGSHAFLDACARPDVLRIVMIDAPAVLGWSEWRAIDRRYGMGSLRAGITEALEAGAIRPLPLDALTHLLSGALNEAVLAIAEAPDPAAAAHETREAVAALIEGLRMPGR